MQVLVTRPSLPAFAVALLGCVMLWSTGCHARPQMTRQQLVTAAEHDLKAGHFHKALLELNQALQSDPNNLSIHQDLGWVYLYTGQLDKASAEVRYIESQDKGNKQIAYLKGALYERLGQTVDALDEYNQALQTDINNPQLHGDVAEAFLKINSPDAALREFEVASKLAPDNERYEFGRCKALRLMDKYTDAIASCKKAILLSKDTTEQVRIREVLENIKLLQSLEAPGQKAKAR